MVDSECPKIITMQDRPFSDLHKTSIPLALCVHLRDKGLNLGEAVWTARQSKSGFSISFHWGTNRESGVAQEKEKKKRESGFSEEKTDIKKIHQIYTAEALSTPGMPNTWPP